MIWGELVHTRALQMLHNPRYAGAFFFGRTRTRKLANGITKYEKPPRDKWHSLLKDVHEGYICWESYEDNLRRLRENAQANGADRRKSPPREGLALLQGLVICGICGKRMTVRYHTRGKERVPDYVCQREGIEYGKAICQNINGGVVDKEVGELLLISVSPLALEVALNVQDELRGRIEEADHLRRQQVERARYEADLARQRYMRVHPDNRLVADSLEAEWNEKLRALTEAQEEYERGRKGDSMILNEDEKSGVLALATDFPRLWNNPNTPVREKKRMARLLIEDITLVKDKTISIHVRFKGGATKSLTIPAPMNAWQIRKTPKAVISQIDQLLDRYTDAEIADILNSTGKVSGTGQPFKANNVANIRRTYGLKNQYNRFKSRKLLTLDEISSMMQISKSTVKKLAKKNMLTSFKYNDKNERLYEFPSNELIPKLREENNRGEVKSL